MNAAALVRLLATDRPGAHYIDVPIRRPDVEANLILQVRFEKTAIICGLRWLEGRFALKPKALRAAIIEELARIEQIARDAGCTEMRHSGGDRARFLPGYDRMPGLPNGRRKAL